MLFATVENESSPAAGRDSISWAFSCACGTGAISCGDGELRVGVGSYAVLPPTDGYSWIRKPNGTIPEIVPTDCGMVFPKPKQRAPQTVITIAATTDEAVTMAILRTAAAQVTA